MRTVSYVQKISGAHGAPWLSRNDNPATDFRLYLQQYLHSVHDVVEPGWRR